MEQFVVTKSQNDNYSDDHVRDIIENHIDGEITQMAKDPYICDRVLVTVTERIDCDALNPSLSRKHGLYIDPAIKTDSILVRGYNPEYLDEHLLQCYFQSVFADGYNSVSELNCVREKEAAVVTFFSVEDLHKVLEKKRHNPLPSIKYYFTVEQFYTNFQGCFWKRRRKNNLSIFPSTASLENHEPDSAASFSQDSLAKTSRNTQKEFEVWEETDLSDSQQTKQCTMSTSEWNLLEHTLKEKFSSSTFELNCNENILYISCTKDSNAVVTEVRKMKSRIESIDISVSTPMMEVLKSEKAKAVFEVCKNKKSDAVFDLMENFLNIHCVDANALENALKMIRKKIGLHEKDNSLGCSKRLHNTCLVQNVLQEHRMKFQKDYIVYISWNNDFSDIFLDGFESDVESVFKQMKQLMSEYETTHTAFELDEASAKYFNAFIQPHKKCYEKVKITTGSSDGNVKFSLSGMKKDIEKVHESMKDLKSKLNRKDIVIKEAFPSHGDYYCIIMRLNSMNMKGIQSSFELNDHCTITYTVPANFDETKQTIDSEKTVGKIKKKLRKVTTSKPIPKRNLTTGPQTKKFTLSQSCSLIIKPFGNIMREKSDILVCVTANSKNLRHTSVSQTFLDNFPSLKETVPQLEFSANGVAFTHFDQPRPVTIAIVALAKWNPQVSNATLSNVITELLSECDNQSKTSLSFPPIGFGRALQFPEDELSTILVSSVKSYISTNTGTCLKAIFLLAPSKKLFFPLTKEAEKHFQLVKRNRSVSSTASSAMTAAAGDGNNDFDDTNSDEQSDCDEDDDDDSQNDDRCIANHLVSLEEAKITMVSLKNLDHLWKKWKTQLEENCIYNEKITGRLAQLPDITDKKILKKAKELSVWIGKEKNERTKCISLLLKGDKQSVKEIKKFIKQTLSDSPKGLKIASDAQKIPPRGTCQYLKYASGLECDTVPPYWQNKQNGQQKQDKLFVDVNTQTFNAIEKLVVQTWKRGLVGVGQDALNIPLRLNIKVTKILRIENTLLFLKYSVLRKTKCVQNTDSVCPSMDKLHGSKGDPETKGVLPTSMELELLHEVNEVYLFHGTNQDVAEKIAKDGFKPNLGNVNGMFGQGCYFAESSTKSDQYSDDSKDRKVGQDLVMLLCRVLMGNAFLCNDQHPSIKSANKLKQPPCRKCYKDVCTCKNSSNFDSVLGDGKWKFREFVVYENSQCYPEYLITYRRQP